MSGPEGKLATPVADGDGERPPMARGRLQPLRVAGRATARDVPPVVSWLFRTVAFREAPLNHPADTRLRTQAGDGVDPRVLPPPVKRWSLTSRQQRLVKSGGAQYAPEIVLGVELVQNDAPLSVDLPGRVLRRNDGGQNANALRAYERSRIVTSLRHNNPCASDFEG